MMVAVVGEGLPQQAVEMPPRGQHLRQVQLAHDRTVAAEHPTPGHGHTDLGRIPVDAHPMQNVEQLAVGDDAWPAPGEFRADPLEHVDLPAGARQQQAGEQAGHRAANDDRARAA